MENQVETAAMNADERGTAGVRKIEDATFVCEVPQTLGAVTKLSVKNGKVIATTESGVQMIVPVGGSKQP